MSLIILEDGSGVDNSNSYVLVKDVDLFCAKLGLSEWNKAGEKEKEEAIFRAMDYIESLSFRGYKVYPLSSYPLRHLKFPRYEIYTEDGDCLDYSVIPFELKNAVSRAAYEELIDSGCLKINTASDSFTRKEKIGSIEIEYSPAESYTVFQYLNDYLKNLISPVTTKLVRT